MGFPFEFATRQNRVCPRNRRQRAASLLMLISGVLAMPSVVAGEEPIPRTASRVLRQPPQLRFEDIAALKGKIVVQEFRAVRDVRFVPKPIGSITTSIAPPAVKTDTPQAEFDVVPRSANQQAGKGAPMPHLWPDARFASATTISLSSPDGGWVVQRLYGPVAPFQHLPLYFEEPGLERCGDSTLCLGQTLLSATHFYGTFAVLPYKMADTPPWRPICLDLHCPDTSLSARCRRIGREFRMKPAIVQATSIAMLFLLFP